MVRTVRVNLEADAGRYIGPVKESETATEGLDRKVEALDRDINKIPPDAAKAAAALRLLGDESGKAGVKLDEMGKRSTSIGAIDKQIERTRLEVKALADEFNRTGNVSVLEKLFGKQSDLKDLEGLGKRLVAAVGEDGKLAGQEFTKNFSASVQGFASTPYIGPIVVGGIVSAIVAASPLIAAALDGALLAGVGLGGIGLGVVGQLHDPGVHAAFVGMGHDLLAELNIATSSFRGPLIESAGIFGDSLRKAISSIDFSSLSKLVVPLASGLGGMLQNLAPGINKAMEAAQPIIMALAQELPKLGGAISDMFQKFARGKDGAVIAIKLIIDALRVLAEFIGNVTEGAAKLVEWLTTHLAKAFHAISDAAGALHMSGLKRGADEVATALDNLSNTDPSGLNKIGGAATKTGDDFAKLTAKINATKDSADTTAAALAGKLFGEIMNVDQATLGWHQSLLSLHDALSQNGLAIDRHTGLVNLNSKAGLENRSAVLQVMTANMQQYQAFIAAGGGAEDATKAYDSNTAALEHQLRMAGYNTAQIDDMIGSLKNVPHSVQADIAMNGLTEAVNHMSDLLAYINHINGRNVGFTVQETDLRTAINEPGNFGHASRWGGIYQHAATGLLRDAKVYSSANPGRYMIAEPATGGEAFVPRFGDYGRSTAILDQAARWYGGRFAAGGGGGVVVNVPVTVNAGLVADQAQLSTMIADQVVRNVKSGGSMRYVIKAVADGQGI